MTLSFEDTKLLEELCNQNGVNHIKILKLLEAVRKNEFKDRRTGIYDTLREILKSNPTERNIEEA